MNIPEHLTLSKFMSTAGFAAKRHDGTYFGCCPICREGKSWGKKKRLFYYPKTKSFYCFNCNESWSDYRWILEACKMTKDELYSEIRNQDYSIDIAQKIESISLTPKGSSNLILPKDSINIFDEQQQHFYRSNSIFQSALRYVRDRRLDTAINRPDTFYISLTDTTYRNRLCIPFKDTRGKIVFFQCRSLDDEYPRYISKVCDKTVYGIDKIDKDFEYIFIFEGPIDSMFVRNGVGLAGLTLTQTQKEQLAPFSLHKRIWVLDNLKFAKDESTREKYTQLLESGEAVFNWKGAPYKDLNEWALFDEFDSLDPERIIDNTLKL